MILSPLPARAFTPVTLTRIFNDPNPHALRQFGGSVSLSGTNALMGSNAESAYLFDTVTGNLVRTFNNPDPQGDFFGFSVSLSSTNALIGASESAYLFDTVTGNLVRTFNDPDPQDEDFFGSPVSLNGTNAFIAGRSVYLFDTITGNLLQTFNNPDPQGGGGFGSPVSLNGTNVLIGALLNNIGGTFAGSAYLFDTITGSLLQTFNTPTPGENQNFAISSSWDGDNLLLGDSGIGKALLYGIAPGGSPDDPILPDIVDDSFVFNFAADPNQTYYIDPDVAIGYDYTVTGGPLFASVVLPSLAAGDNIYNLFADTSGGSCSSFGDTGITIAAGDVFNFASPTNCFGIRGIEVAAGLDPTDVTAFVTGVTFDVLGTVTVTQTPIVEPVPEPLTLLGASAAVAFGAAFKRRRRA